MTVKLFRLREDGERMKSYKAITHVKAIERTDTGLELTLYRGFETTKFTFDFEGNEYEMEVYP